MTKTRFKFLFAYRNIVRHKKNSLVVILTLSLVFSLLIVLLGMRFTFSKIYEFQAENVYQDIDIVMTYDEYSSSRLINRRLITDNYADEVNYSLSFFNLDVLIDGAEGSYYAKLISSLPSEFELLMNKDVMTRDDEAIITETYAAKYGLKIGDTISFNVLDKVYSYQVGDIYPDNGVFTDVTFYVDKSILFDDLYNLGALTNFGNTIYIYVNDGYDIDQVIQEMKVDSNFSGYSIFPTLDWDYINNKAMDLVAMLLALGLIVMMAVVMVLDSLFPIVNINLRQQLGVTKTLGANSKFIWHVNLIQWLIYTIISFLIGMGLSLFIINYGIHVYGFDGYIPLKLLTIVLAFTIVSTFIVLRALISFHRENRQSIASQSKNRRFNRLKIKYPLVALALVVLAVELIFKPFGLAIHSLIIVITSIYLALNLSSVILVYMSEWIGKARKKSLFSIFQLKYLRTNMHIQQSLRVVVISLLAVVLIFAVRTFMFNEIDNFYDAVRFDLAIVNVYDYDDALMDEIETYDITYAQDAIFYRDIEINFSEDDLETCRFFVSMDYENLNQFFNFDYDIQSIDPSYISDETPYVILPINFQLIHQVNIGDTITLDLNAKLEDISVVIAGFIDTNFDNILYSNIIHVGAYENVAKPNAIFVNTDNKDLLFQDFVRDFSARMYYIMDPDIYFESVISSVENITDFFTVFTMFMIVCFVIIIFNNTILVFYGLKSDLAKIKVMGARTKTFGINLTKEFAMLFSIVIVIGLIEIEILSKYLTYVVLLTNYYKNIHTTPLTNIYGCVIVGIVMISSYVYYCYQINKIKIIEEIKIY